MSEWHYFATAQPPTAVLHALGPLCFTSPGATDLVVAWATRIEVFHIGAEGGLEALCSCPIHGRIALLQAVRPRGASSDLLLLCTERRQLVILRYDSDARRPVAVATGSLQDPLSRPLDHLPLCACDPDGLVTAAHMHEGRLSLIALDGLMSTPSAGATDLRAGGRLFEVSIGEQRLLDIAFASDAAGAAASSSAGGARRPCLMALHVDHQGDRHLSEWTVDVQRSEAAPNSAAARPAAPGAERLLPVGRPHGGVLVLGGSLVAYHDSARCRRGEVRGGPRHVAAAALLRRPGSTWVVGGTDGSLWLLCFRLGGDQAVPSTTAPTFALQCLGTASPPRALACLTEERIFVGSACGDSQVLRLSHGAPADGTHFAVEDTWVNLGPIVDFCVADVDDRGQNQVVTCSGIGSTGSLRFVRIGVGVEEVASVGDVGGVTGMWVVGGMDSGVSRLLVLSFVKSTRLLGMAADGTEFVEHCLPSFSSAEETLFCCECAGLVLQVLRGGVRAISMGLWQPLRQWAAPAGACVRFAASAPGGVLLGTASGELLLLRVGAAGGGTALEVAARWRLDAEIACLDTDAGLCSVGLWTPELRVLLLQGPDRFTAEALPCETIPRAVAFARLAGVLHLMVGLGNGWLISFHVDEETGALSQRRSVHIGAQPLRLVPFRPQFHAGEHVFATGNRPMIIHDDARGQLAYAAVNLRHVSHVAGLDAVKFPGCLVLVTEGRLMIGAMEDIRRVHMRTLPLGESPHRVCWHRRARALVVACQPLPDEDRAVPAAEPCPGGGQARASLRWVHGQSLETLQRLELQPCEQVSSMCTIVFEGDATEFLAVGTAFLYKDEPEPLRGHVLLYAPQGAAGGAPFVLAGRHEVQGAVYSLVPFRGMLLGSVNNRVCIWRHHPAPEAPAGHCLQELCWHSSASIIALHVQGCGEHVLVGDLMRSASLLHYSADPPELREVARDGSTAWLCAAEMLGEGLFLCADDSHNLFALACREDPAAAGAGAAADGQGAAREPLPAARRVLERVGQMHAGEFVNRLHRAVLVEHPAPTAGGPDGSSCSDARGVRSSPPQEQAIWASADGAIGLVATLGSEQQFARLSLVQNAVAQQADTLACLPHSEWRDICGATSASVPHRGFIDGDMLEQLLRLPRRSQQAIVDDLSAQGVMVDGVDGLLHEVEELAWLH